MWWSWEVIKMLLLPACSWQALKIPELIPNCGAVTTRTWIAPGHNTTIYQNRSKSTFCGLNLLHPLQLIFYCRAVTTWIWIPPCNDGAICQDRRWCWTAELSPPKDGLPHVTTEPSSRIAANAPLVAWTCCTFLSCSWTAELSPPNAEKPHVTTEPSARIAANATSVAWICCTPLSKCRTAELSPPDTARPHVTTEPFWRIAAKAAFVAWTCCTFLSWSSTAELSPPQSRWPHVTTPSPPQHQAAKACRFDASFARPTIAVSWSPSWSPAAWRVCIGSLRMHPAAVASRKEPCPKDFWANLFKSSLEDSRIERLSLRPLARATVTSIIEDTDAQYCTTCSTKSRAKSYWHRAARVTIYPSFG